MGVGLMQTAVVAFGLWLVGFVGHQLGRTRERTGLAVVARAAGGTPKIKRFRCAVCHGEFPVDVIEPDTGTCGAAGCVAKVMAGRAKMAAARVATNQARIEQVREQAYRKDGSPMHADDGTPVMVPVAGRFERVEGGPPDEKDRRALAWAREHGVIEKG